MYRVDVSGVYEEEGGPSVGVRACDRVRRARVPLEFPPNL